MATNSSHAHCIVRRPTSQGNEAGVLLRADITLRQQQNVCVAVAACDAQTWESTAQWLATMRDTVLGAIAQDQAKPLSSIEHMLSVRARLSACLPAILLNLVPSWLNSRMSSDACPSLVSRQSTGVNVCCYTSASRLRLLQASHGTAAASTIG